jgi:hypothetical protein
LRSQIDRSGDRTQTGCHSSTSESRLLDSNLYERSGNVYENKGSVQKSTTPDPSLSREGNSGLPSSDEEGLGVVRLCKTKPVAPLSLGLCTPGFRQLKGDKGSGWSQASHLTTFSQDFGRVPLHLGVLVRKPPYIVFSLLTRPSLCATFAGLRSEAGRSQ